MARKLVAEDKSRHRATTTNNNQPLTRAFSHANIPSRLWRHPCRPVPCTTGAVSLCPPPPLLGHWEAGEYSWMVSPLMGVWDVVAVQQKGMGRGWAQQRQQQPWPRQMDCSSIHQRRTWWPITGSVEQLAVGCKSLIFHSNKCVSHLLLISFLFAIIFLYHFTWKLCATGCSLQNYYLCATLCFTQCNTKQLK
jgi:hypothetical protein